MITRNCVFCGKEFVKKPKESHIQFKGRTYCSSSCFGKVNMLDKEKIDVSIKKLKKYMQEHGAWNKGKPLSKKHLESLSKSLKGRKVWIKGLTKDTDERVRKLGEEHSEKLKKLFIEGKLKSPRKGKSYEELYGVEKAKKLKEQVSKRNIKRLVERVIPQANTKPERILKKELVKLGFKEGKDFIHQYDFYGRYVCDFAFPEIKLIIEVQGDFWHANPSKYPYDENRMEANLRPIQIRAVKRDKSKMAYITKMGWRYVYFWEYFIINDTENVVNAIKTIIENRKKE